MARRFGLIAAWNDEQLSTGDHVVEGDGGVVILAIYVRVMVWREVELVEISYGSLAFCKDFFVFGKFFCFSVMNADIRCFMSGEEEEEVLHFTFHTVCRGLQGTLIE